MLHFKNVKKYYSSFLALDIPDLTIGHGLWWLQGENGSGKTTFLKMIAGLHPFIGDLYVDDIYSIKKHRLPFIRSINYAEAEPLYPPFLTAKDLITLYCKTKKGSIDEAAEMLQQLHVFHAYEKQLGTYSSGMIKKLSLVLAFIGNPKFILLDEPLITIDVLALEVICNIIKDKFEHGISFIITSHQQVNRDQLMFTGFIKAADQRIMFLPDGHNI
ncbi:MAG TPA: ATP-binding cassette domain-containing protein [Segetibacter sp.]|jgi:ABC-2 type transport system ATP-binding protein